ncbi:MAG: hypothetical protein KDH89_18990 [Anaerolineae bacterium]|nr:hypothetical protein [Anaerolineae bacterium]
MSADENPLSKREQEILTLVARGLTNQEIAKELVISHNTVKVHLRNIFAKLEVVSRTEATVKAAQSGWIDLAGIEEQTDDEAAPAALPPALPPLARWQRVYFFLAASLVLLALLAPNLLTRLEAQAPENDLSDAGRAEIGSVTRVATNRWNSLAALPFARSRLALVALDDVLYAIGGEDADGPASDVDVYDPETNGWLPRTALPMPVANVQAAAVDDQIFIPGGTAADGTTNAGLQVYDATSDSWQAGAMMPAPRAGYALAALDDTLYLFGGWDGTAYSDSVWEYDPAGDVWMQRSPLPRAIGFAGAAAFDDRILVAGGFDGVSEYADCSLYYPEDDRWETCAPMILPRGGLGLAVDGTSVYAIGGGWQRAMGFNERYDTLTNTWSSIPSPVPGQWLNPGIASRGSQVYAVGGWSGGYLDFNEAFQSTFRAFLPLGTRGQPGEAGGQ